VVYSNIRLMTSGISTGNSLRNFKSRDIQSSQDSLISKSLIEFYF